ncbi:MAG TPA: 3-deoxy-8-phosphooctulonate synthase, partial [Elusimicrobiales bacterium]|nr:3-deoxy-8-phosphooctulonate synthase [Elusimicrobiales bacterium]
MKTKTVSVGRVTFRNDKPLSFIAGPCVIESEKMFLRTARELKRTFSSCGAGFVLKASFDKANRTSITSFRGPGLHEGLQIIARVKKALGVPVVIDVHEPAQAERVAEAADLLQVPAFLCRQTDLLMACARTGLPVNVKKGQFLAPWDMANIIKKLRCAGCDNILLTERGSSFGYGNLVVDMRSLEIMKDFGCPVIFDCTHSVQKPGGLGTATGGDSRHIPALARAAAAVGVAGIFMEAHPNPVKALSDGPNSLRLNSVRPLVSSLKAI